MPFTRFYVRVTVLCLLGVVLVSAKLKNIECKDIISKSVDLSLKNYLLCDYDTTIRPSLNRKNATEIKFALIPKFIEFEDYTNTFKVHAWTIFGWTDIHLKWEPEKFNYTRGIRVNSDEIWTPDIAVHNSGDLSKDQNEIPFTICELYYNGGIMCVASSTYTVLCQADYTMWPYDTQNCTIELASWSHSGMEIAFKFIRNVVMLDDYRPNWQWKLVSSGANYHVNNYKFKSKDSSPMITIHFLLERQPEAMHSAFIIPIFVLIVLTLTTMWLDAKSTERTTVACINFYCHLLAMLYLYWVLPFNGAEAPRLMIFYEFSFTMAAFSLIMSMILREMLELPFAPPTFISAATISILKSKIGQVLFLTILDPKATAGLDIDADDNEDIINSGKKQNLWEYVAVLVSWMSFIVASFIYVVILCMYMPRKVF